MLRKMFLVSADYLNTVTSNNINTPATPPPDTVRKASKAGEKHNSSKRRTVKKIKKKKYTPKREHDRCVANAPRRDETMISGLKYVPNFTRRMSKGSQIDCRRFHKASTTSLLLIAAGTQTEHGPTKRKKILTSSSSYNPRETSYSI